MMLLAVLLGVTPAGADEILHGRARVVDGDSLELGGRQLRLWGVDAPELRQTCRRGADRWPCGREATRALRAQLKDRIVRCEVVDSDTYERAVARCTQAGRSVNEWLVREGWALDYRRYSRGRYASAQSAAQSAKRGLWSGTFETPEHYRRRQPR